MNEPRTLRRLAAILAADVVGFSHLMGIDEEGTLRALVEHRDQLIDPEIAEHKGRIFKTTGDGALVEFASAVEAVRCAVRIQQRMAERNAEVPADRRIQIRIGVNVGDVIVQGEDVFGDGVNVAARLEGLAEPGGVIVSADVFNQVRDRVDLAFDDLGEKELKNIARPIRIYRARDRSEGEAVGQREIAPPRDRPSIAVLAFNNMSGDPEQEYFSDGISEDIITDLSKISGLHVIARNSTFTYKGKPVDLKQVGRELGVRYVLEGSVRKAGNRVRVTGQLIDAASGAHVWADRYDRDLTDIFAVQDELTREIINALKVKLSPEQEGRLAKVRTIDVKAYELFLRAREQAFILTPGTNVEARRLLERAIEISPNYSAAHAYIAFTLVNDYLAGHSEDADRNLETALKIAERAVAMDEDDPYAHVVLSMVLLWHRRYDAALQHTHKALEIAPNMAEGYFEIANIQFYRGDAADSIETIKTYMQLDPLYPEVALYFLAQAQVSLGQYEEAVNTLKRRLQRNPNSETSYALLASCYGHLGRFEESRAAWAEALRIAPHFSIERRRRILPFKDPAMFEHRLDGMRKAGIAV